MVLSLVKYWFTFIWSWWVLINSNCSWNILGPFVCLNHSLKPSQISWAVLEYHKLAAISLETEFRIQEMTKLLFLIQEFVRSKSLFSGFVMDPSNPSLFLVDRVITMVVSKKRSSLRSTQVTFQASGSDEDSKGLSSHWLDSTSWAILGRKEIKGKDRGIQWWGYLNSIEIKKQLLVIAWELRGSGMPVDCSSDTILQRLEGNHRTQKLEEKHFLLLLTYIRIKEDNRYL